MPTVAVRPEAGVDQELRAAPRQLDRDRLGRVPADVREPLAGADPAILRGEDHHLRALVTREDAQGGRPVHSDRFEQAIASICIRRQRSASYEKREHFLIAFQPDVFRWYGSRPH